MHKTLSIATAVGSSGSSTRRLKVTEKLAQVDDNKMQSRLPTQKEAVRQSSQGGYISV